MAVLLNIRKLLKESICLKGTISAAELEIEGLDELIHTPLPLTYEIEAQSMDDGILLQGHLRLPLECECARCLKPFEAEIDLPDWACLIPLTGDDKVVVDNDDSVDLTPYFREDMLFGFPQHPLCKTNCKGLPARSVKTSRKKSGGISPNTEASSVWSELNKLKF